MKNFINHHGFHSKMWDQSRAGFLIVGQIQLLGVGFDQKVIIINDRIQLRMIEKDDIKSKSQLILTFWLITTIFDLLIGF